MYVIFDIDGTLADISHRLKYLEREPKDWEAFYETMSNDKPIEPMIQIAKALKNDVGMDANLIFVTGRPEKYRELTVKWLASQFGAMRTWVDNRLYMRKDGDFRSDVEIKSEILKQLHKDGIKPEMAFEDRARVAEMWRKKGLICLQCAEGNY